jgi:ferrous iron transport protein A
MLTLEAKTSMTRSRLTIPLIESKKGQRMRIVSIPQGHLRAQFIRIGLHEGEKILCYERLPGGTIVVKKNRQQVAIGHKLAKEILVVPLENDDA